MAPYIRHGQGDEFREASRAIHADSGRMGAEVTPSRHTVPAPAAHNMTLSRDQFARMEVIHVGTDGDDFADKLMTDNHGNRNRAARPCVPVVNVDIGAADSRSKNANQDIIDSNGRFGTILQPQSLLRVCFDESFHRGIVSDTDSKDVTIPPAAMRP
jgi:hypothetical protein